MIWTQVEDSVCCLVNAWWKLLLLRWCKNVTTFHMHPIFYSSFLFQARGRRRRGERKRKHKHADLEGSLCFEADKYNLSWDCQALGLSLHIGKKRQVRLIWGLHYLLHLAWLGTAPSLYKPITPSKASAEWPLMGSDMAGMGLTQPGDKGPRTRAKTLPAPRPRCSTTKERNELKRSQGLWARGDFRIPRSTWFPPAEHWMGPWCGLSDWRVFQWPGALFNLALESQWG